MVRLWLIVILTILLTSGCKEDLEFPGKKDFPVVILENPSDKNVDGVTLSGSLIMNMLQYHPAISYGFIIDESSLGIDTILMGQAESSVHFSYRYENFSITDRSIDIQAFGKDEYNTYLSNRKTINLEGESHKIHGFNPKEGIKGDTVVITGYRFSSETNPVIKINEAVAPILNVSPDSIVIEVPSSMGNPKGVLSVIIDNHEVMASDTFNYQKPVILDINTNIAWENDTIVITGENFSNDAEVIIGDATTQVLDQSKCHLVVHLEKVTFRVIEELVLSSDGFATHSPEPFHLLSPWKQIRDFPIKTSFGMGFAINNKGHAGSGSFYEYNPTTNLWIQKSDIPFNGIYSSGFVVDNRGFVIRTYPWWPERLLYEFVPDENDWVQKTSLPSNSARISTLEVNNRVFAYGGNTDDDNAPNFFEYKPHSNSWHPSAHLSAPVISRTITFSIDNDGYMGTGIDYLSGALINTIYRYNLLNDSWTEVSDFPISIADGIGFSINGIGYAGLGRTGQNENKNIYAYDPNINQWQWVAEYPTIYTRGCIVFIIGEKAYIGTGSNLPGPGEYPAKTSCFYEFDPKYLRENYRQ